jgi:integrative and conjugative element protein (TIGR02256 family)
MVREARSKLPLETGGVLVGYWANADEAVIRRASGPGPDAEHFRHRFRPDHDYQTAWIAMHYRDSQGLETYLGDWHTHPGARTASPSWTDRSTARRIAACAEARAPRPLTLILAGNNAEWSPACWVAALKPVLGFWDRVQLSACLVKTYPDD